MKIRNGFVSNSSSTSFVVVLPDNFDVNSLECNDGVKKFVKLLIKNKTIWNEEMSGEYDDVEKFQDVMKPFIICEVDGGPDEGKYCLGNNDKIRSILKG